MSDSLLWSIVLAVSVVVLALGVLRGLRRPRQGPTVPVPLHLDERARSEISALVATDQKIQAIKRLREESRLGLAEAKGVIDHWDPATTGTPEAGPDLTDLESTTRAVVVAQGEVAAVKHVRDHTGWGLLEAKRFVDRLDGV
ncbi:hypothetical protein [Aeromicrobium alkaliterrae]|uniref:Ribosomal protein L7/L12 C-terminal domain-containing protein n=1 Tax=Aeromicrobium alkaliterrae TaxID=302168 RepID=A0ABN2JKQ2_9ACTN